MRGHSPYEMVAAMLWVGAVCCLLLAGLALFASPIVSALTLILAAALIVLAVRLRN